MTDGLEGSKNFRTGEWEMACLRVLNAAACSGFHCHYASFFSKSRSGAMIIDVLGTEWERELKTRKTRCRSALDMGVGKFVTACTLATSGLRLSAVTTRPI